MQKIDINLKTRRARMDVPVYALIALIALAMAYTWRNASVYLDARAALSRLSDRVRELQKRAPEAAPAAGPTADMRLVRKEADFLNDVMAREAFSWTELLSDLESSVPQGVSIVQISPDFNAGKIRIAGLARTMKDVFSLVDRMNSSARFKDVFLLRHSGGGKAPNAPGGVEEILMFNITAAYAGGK